MSQIMIKTAYWAFMKKKTGDIFKKIIIYQLDIFIYSCNKTT